jgi:predicted transcriptional regulator
MSAAKQLVIEVIQRLPDDATLDEILAELHFRRKIDAGLAQLDAGEGIDHEAVKDRIVRNRRQMC